MKVQRGFSMIELLISVLIMSIGVLGMAGLQTLSLQQNRSALLQGEAGLLVNDILDRIRANPSSDYSGIALNTVPGSTTNCVGSICSEVEMMNFDRTQWLCSINSTDAAGVQHTVCGDFGVTGTMPGGQCVALTDPCAGGSIVLAGGIYTVTVQWLDQQTVDQTNGQRRSVSVSMKAP